MSKKMYYHINHHKDAASEFIPDSYFICNLGIIDRKMLTDIGGLDCNFEAPAMALVDMSIRLQKSGVTMLLQREVAYHEDWNPSDGGTHGPIHDAMVNNDVPFYQALWRDKACKDRITVPLDNWMESREIWERRFGDVGNEKS